MKIVRDAFVGIAAALTTSLLVVGAIALAMTEGMVLPDAPVEQPTAEPAVAMGTYFPGFAPTAPRPTAASRLVPGPTKSAIKPCAIPPGWEKMTLSAGQTLSALAEARGASLTLVIEKNCLSSASSVMPDTDVYLPPVTPTATLLPLAATATLAPTPTPSFTPVRCGVQRGWVPYRVQPGDTLYRISTIYGISVSELQLGNCMGWNNFIQVGQSILVPNVAPRYTVTNTATFTPPPPTAIPFTPTFTRTVKVSTATFTPIPATRTFTPVFTATFTPAAATNTPTRTPAGATNTPTRTPAPINTPTPTPTSVGTNTPAKPSSLTSTFTFTPTGK